MPEAGRLKAVGLLVGHGSDLTLHDNMGDSALAFAKRCAAGAIEEGDVEGAKIVVATLEMHGVA